MKVTLIYGAFLSIGIGKSHVVRREREHRWRRWKRRRRYLLILLSILPPIPPLLLHGSTAAAAAEGGYLRTHPRAAAAATRKSKVGTANFGNLLPWRTYPVLHRWSPSKLHLQQT